LGESSIIIRDFDTDLKNGERAEDLILSKFKTVIQPIVMHIAYKDGLVAKELQRRGIDAFVQQKESGFDVKVRDFKYYRFKDILLETKSVREKDIPGWLYKATVVVYLWWNPLRTKFVDGYALFLRNIRDWMSVTQFNYRKKIAFSSRNGQQWSTENIIIPISEFPIGCVMRLSRKEFMDNSQVTLATFFDNKGFV